MVHRSDVDADKCYDADSRCLLGRIFANIGVGLLYRSEGKGTYIMPNPNMLLKVIFFPTAICKPHRTGMGSITTATSISRLKMPMKRSSDF